MTSITPGLTSIIIPTYNHGAYVREAIDSARAQTADVEVIVVDDGSTDLSPQILDVIERADPDRMRVLYQANSGPASARNLGLVVAEGEFVMFLDADDVIAPTKVEEQLREFTPDIGWVLCDVKIIDDAKRRTITASEQYDYGRRALNGWIDKQLVRENFIPIMSPLVRRSVLEGLAFDDRRVPEDWYFWQEVAARARVSYVPSVLAEYRHRVTGRSRGAQVSTVVLPPAEPPLRLNLGCGTPGTRSWHPMPGLVNLDKSLGWSFEDGLGQFADGSAAGITISHALMYVALDRWPSLFADFARVLQPGGVIRITEDDTTNPNSSRRGGWKGSQPAVTLTDADRVGNHLFDASLGVIMYHNSLTTWYRDQSLCQAQHGDPPDVFFIEGVKRS